jgi:osmotically-inducible protein OsmY
MEDKYLRQSIIDELDFEPTIDAADIGVAVEDGVATLTGHVGSYAEKLAVEDAVRRVRGVKAIAEEVEVRYPDGKKTADDQIAKRALDILAWDTSVPNERIQVKVQRGWLTLTGEVDWNYQRTAAEQAVRKLGGITGISNLITLKAIPKTDDVKDKIEAALKRSAELESDKIRVSVIGGRVRLEGKVKAWYERQIAEQAAWAVSGVATVEDNLQLG